MSCFIKQKVRKKESSSVSPNLFINDVKIKRENSLKFLGVMIDENLT